MNIGELFIFLGFDVDDKKLKAFKEDIKDGLNSLLKMSAAGAAAVYAINTFVEGAIRTSTALSDISVETGMATDAMQRWANVISTTDPSASFDQVLQTIHSIQDAITKSKLAGADPHAFAMLGIQNFQNLNGTQVLDVLRRAYQQNPAIFGDKNFLSLLYKDLGISNPASLIKSFQLSDSQFQKKWDLPIFTQDQIQKNVALGNSIDTLTNRLEYLRGVWTADWSTTLQTNIDKIIPAMKKLSDYLKPVNDAMTGLAGQNWQGIAVGFGILTAAFLTISAPAALFAASLAGIVFSLHEIGTMMEGKSDRFLHFFGLDGPEAMVLAGMGGADIAKGTLDSSMKNLASMERNLNAAAAQQDVTQNFTTTNHINSTADAHDLAARMDELQKASWGIARQNFVPWGQ